MKVCFVVNEFFGWGKFGGFGSATRSIATGLAERGLEVEVVTPMRAGQKPLELVDGITVRGFEALSPRAQIDAYRASDAQIYHSQDPSIGTLLAQIAMPERRHLVTFQDPRTLADWKIEIACYLAERRFKSLLTWPYEDNPLVWRAVRRTDAQFSEARHIVPKAAQKYRLARPPTFLPNPVTLVETSIAKATRPTVCFIGRWDRRKRPELFFELANRWPAVRFIAIGAANSKRMDQRLRERYAGVANLELPGFVDRFSSPRFHEILSEAWILVNTSAREGLPVTFLEAASYRCAILSQVDPDGFASRFGHHAADGDFDTGLSRLLAGDRWRPLGEQARDYVRQVHATEVVVDLHRRAYGAVLRGEKPPAAA